MALVVFTIPPTAASQTSPSLETQKEKNYIKPPRLVQKNKLSPQLTNIFLNLTNTALNNDLVNFKTQGGFSTNYLFGTAHNHNLSLKGLYTLNSQIEQSLTRDNIFTSDFNGYYLQLKMVPIDHQITVVETIPQTMQGMLLQMSFTGSCSAVTHQENNPSQQHCALIPAFAIERDSIDPNSFLPTRIEQYGGFGREVSPETLAILAQSGFQKVGSDGEVVGVEFYAPKVGMQPGNTDSTHTHVSRTEKVHTVPLFGAASVRKILKTNYAGTVMGLTIRGIGGVWEDSQSTSNLALALGAQMLPDVIPQIAGSTQKNSTNINTNLLKAPHLVRLPSSRSWTIYQAGLGYAAHPKVKGMLPNAYFNSIWLGLSPVTERHFSTQFFYQPTGAERITLFAGSEGGVLDNISFVANVNGNEIQSAQLDEFYAQAYLTFLARDVNLINTSQLTYQTTYYPHLSLTGDIVGSQQVFRYYGGLIAANSLKAYLGLDYRRQFWQKKWSAFGSAIGYLNPDPDYFSHLKSRLSRSFILGQSVKGEMFSELRYAFAQNVDNFLEKPIDNYFVIGLNSDYKSTASIGLTYYLDQIVPDAIDTGLGVNTTWKVSQHSSFQVFLTPSTNRKSYGIAATHRFSKWGNLVLQAKWQRNVYEYGFDPFDHLITSKDDVFSFNLGGTW